MKATEDQETNNGILQKLVELPMYHKWHASLSSDLTDKDKLFDRNIIGITLPDADRIYQTTGCKSLEQYLIRLALNDSVFTGLLKKCLGGRNRLAVNLVAQIREMVEDLSILHRVSFLMRHGFKDEVCRAPLDDHTNSKSMFARQLLQIDILGAKCIRKGTNNMANSIESLIALYCHRQGAEVQL